MMEEDNPPQCLPFSDPFPVYNHHLETLETDTFNLSKSDAEGLALLDFRQSILPGRYVKKPHRFGCSECGVSIGPFDRSHYCCFECLGSFSVSRNQRNSEQKCENGLGRRICSTCFDVLELGHHTHQNNRIGAYSLAVAGSGSQSETDRLRLLGENKNEYNFVVELRRPLWATGLLMDSRRDDSSIRFSDELKCIFREYSPRAFLGTRPIPQDPTFFWLTYSDIFRLSLRMAKSIGFVKSKRMRSGSGATPKTPSVTFVGVLSGIRVSVPVVWFGCHFAGIPFVPIQVIMSVEEKSAIVHECPLDILFTERRFVDEIREVYLERQGDDADADADADTPPLVVVLDDDVRDLLLGEERRTVSVEEMDQKEDSQIEVVSLLEFLAFGDSETDVKLNSGLQDDDLCCVLYTSGTTGLPKGVRLSVSAWKAATQMAQVDGPIVKLAHGPLSHMTGMLFILFTFYSGGRVATLCLGDTTNFFDDCKYLRPTHLTVFPRMLNYIYDLFHQRCAMRPGDDGHRQKVYEGMREVFGDRLKDLGVGSAYCSPKVKGFIRRLTRMPVVDGYGITEVGAIATEHWINKGVLCKLLPCPELGYSPDDLPYPRGELLVSTKLSRQVGYFKNPGVTSERFDSDGFFRSGDVVEIRGPRIILLDRRSNVVKLSHGEFISLERLESCLQTSPLLLQVVAFSNPPKTCFVAIVQVGIESDVDPALVLDEIRRVGKEQNLPIWAIPVKAIVSSDPLPLTGVKKKARKRIREAFEEELQVLFAQSMESSSGSGCGFDFVQHLRDLLGHPAELEMDSLWEEAGGDSLTGVALMSTLRSMGVSHPFHDIKAMKISEIVNMVKRSQMGEELASPQDQSVVSHLSSDSLVTLEKERLEFEALSLFLLSSFVDDRSSHKDRLTFFVTGASGFLGGEVLRCLSEKLTDLKSYEIICLVRPSSEARLQLSLLNYPEGLVRLVVGDLAKPDFGLSPSDFDDLCQAVDVIVHCGAMVNHLLWYHDHYDTNVRSLHEILRLSQGWKPILHVSSMSVFSNYSNLDVRCEEHRQGNGYAASKWASDVLISEFCGHHCLIVRPPLICGSSLTGRCNKTDWLCRAILSMLHTASGPSRNLNGNVPFNMISVDYLADFIASLAIQMGESVSRTEGPPESFEFGDINVSFANVTIDQIVEFVARYYQEEERLLDDECPSFQHIPFPEWIQELRKDDSLPITPFVHDFSQVGRLGPSKFVATDMSRFETTPTKLDYEGFKRIAQALLQGMKVDG